MIPPNSSAQSMMHAADSTVDPTSEAMTARVIGDIQPVTGNVAHISLCYLIYAN